MALDLTDDLQKFLYEKQKDLIMIWAYEGWPSEPQHSQQYLDTFNATNYMWVSETKEKLKNRSWWSHNINNSSV